MEDSYQKALDGISTLSTNKKHIVDPNWKQLKRLTTAMKDDDRDDREPLQYSPEFLRLLHNYLASTVMFNNLAKNIWESIDSETFNETEYTDFRDDYLPRDQRIFLRYLRNYFTHVNTPEASSVTVFGGSHNGFSEGQNYGIIISDNMIEDMKQEDRSEVLLDYITKFDETISIENETKTYQESFEEFFDALNTKLDEYIRNHPESGFAPVE